MAILKQKVGTVAVERTIVANYDDSTVVHKSGNESIAGVKTFVESPQVPSVASVDASMNVANTKFVKDVVSAAVSAAFDAIYPIGSYAFGVQPGVGTWEEVEGDRALWLKNDADDGTTIEQALPNITGSTRFNSQGGFISKEADSYSKGALQIGDTLEYTFILSGTGNPWVKNNNGRELALDASKANSIYKDNANVQPNAYVMKVYKRVA